MAVHKLVILSYSKSLKLLVGLSIDGLTVGGEIYEARLRDMQDDVTQSDRQGNSVLG